MTLDEVDLQCLLLDQLAEARVRARAKPNGGETVGDAVAAAMTGG